MHWYPYLPIQENENVILTILESLGSKTTTSGSILYDGNRKNYILVRVEVRFLILHPRCSFRQCEVDQLRQDDSRSSFQVSVGS